MEGRYWQGLVAKNGKGLKNQRRNVILGHELKEKTHRIAKERDEGFRVDEGRQEAVARAKRSW